MFTGLIRDVGEVETFELHGDTTVRLKILTRLESQHLALGASVACNGCCLTVTESGSRPDKRNFFFVEAGPQTLALTRFARAVPGTLINLEPALCAGEPLGGHVVSGHIDALIEIKELCPIGEGFYKMVLAVPPQYARWVISKGSLAVCGVSLTIASLSSLPDESLALEIMLIPHTWKSTIFSFCHPGEQVEVEFDQTIKAIASTLEIMLPTYLQAAINRLG